MSSKTVLHSGPQCSLACHPRAKRGALGKSIVAKCNVYKNFTALVAANLTADYNNLPDKLERTAFRGGWGCVEFLLLSPSVIKCNLHTRGILKNYPLNSFFSNITPHLSKQPAK